MAKLAILGHATRGKEVIEILEMLGGRTAYLYNGDDGNAVYFIDGLYIMAYKCEDINRKKYSIFTLEEFIEKFPYKIGDKVSSKYLKNYKIERMEWEDANNRVIYKLQGMGWYNADELQPYKEETEEEKLGQIIFDIPDGYEFFGINDDNKIVLTKKQSKYPKTYEECCKVMGIDHDNFLSIRNLCADDGEEETTKYEQDLLDGLTYLWELKICRDAYWKIAGEQMGLGKPWEPMFSNPLLNFPTDEMRDAFYENFKDLIEECKEFL